MIGSSDLNAVAEGEADAAVGANRCMIQQFSPGLRVKCCHLLRRAEDGHALGRGGAEVAAFTFVKPFFTGSAAA